MSNDAIQSDSSSPKKINTQEVSLSLKGLSSRIVRHMSASPENEFGGMDFVQNSLHGIKKGSVYATLQRMEARGWLTSRQESPRANEPVHIIRRLYKLTPLALSDLQKSINETAGVTNAKAE